VLSGLHHSHELFDLNHTPLNVVHRDVSPHNVMISYEGVVKVLDFGIAKLSGSTVETEAGVIKGKLRYMPPEQVAGEAVDRRADVFAVGVMLWEALSGAKLWHGLSDAAIMNRVLAGQIPPPLDPDGVIAPELLEICARALAPERQNRYETALEFALALEEYLAKTSHHVSTRELGAFMSERFASLRRAVQERIEGELSMGESSRPPERGSAAPRGATPSRTGFAASSNSRYEPPRSKTWMVALGLVVLGVAIMAWGLRGKPPAGGATSMSPAPRRVSVSIEARPETASIAIDGQPVPNPYRESRVLDARRHSVRVSAPGFVSEETDVSFETDVRMFRALSPLAPSASGSPGVASAASTIRPLARPAPAAAPAPSQSVSAPSCDPPYSLDAQGTKMFKPACL
jgi:eukaryotic-like serine/threonine-protein kinase